jgi:hypothetical protein
MIRVKKSSFRLILIGLILVIALLGGWLLRGSPQAASDRVADTITSGPTSTPLPTLTPTPTLTITPTFEPVSETVTLWPPPTLASLTLLTATYEPLSQGADSHSEALDLPAGVYRIRVQSAEGFAALVPVVEDGMCATYPLFLNGAAAFDGSATYTSTGCRVRFEMRNASGEWALTVETAAQGGRLAVPQTLSGDQPAASPLMNLPAGEYNLVIITKSPYTQVIPVVVAGTCLERPVFLLNEPGQYKATYFSTGCEIIFQIDAVTADWEFNITRRNL